MTSGQDPNSKPGTNAALTPGIAAVCIWNLLLCGIGLIGVITHNLPPAVIILCVIYAVAANGLAKLRRWAWALTLAAAFLSMCYGVYVLFRFHQLPMVVMIAVNLVIFLYLVRAEIIERLK